MPFKDLREWQNKMFPGVGPDRIAERTQGCWNCVHADYEKAAKLWWEEARGKLLARAVAVAVEHPLGENAPAVRNIRTQVPLLDAKFTVGEYIACSRGVKPDKSDLGTFIHRTYLCERWTARDGASVAREAKAPDKLPEEIHERIHEKLVD